MTLATVDYETKGIELRPHYPPVPVGVAIKFRQHKKYYAWGHPTKNNCTKADAVRAIKQTYREASGAIYHNAPFDTEVEQVHLKIKSPRVIHDTQILAYLFDPRVLSLSLKPLSEMYLNMPPEEQNKLNDWIAENIPQVKGMPNTKTKSGFYISEAPGNLVGRYAVGDVVRTEKLFKYFMPIIEELGMLDAYNRELKLLPIKKEMEQGGLPVNAKKIKRELKGYNKLSDDLKRKITRKLKVTKAIEADCPKGFFNLNSDKQLVDRLYETGKVESFILTDKGNPSVSMPNLRKTCNDKKLLDMLGVYSTLQTYIGTFLTPWLETAEQGGGYIYPTFNTIRSTDSVTGKGYGTKTGRPSSSNPNLNNVPASVEGSRNEYILLLLQKWLKDYGVNFIGLRDYIQPDEGHILLDRDYSQQEIRVLAHYEDGELLQRFLYYPDLNIHKDNHQRILDLTGVNYVHKKIKITSFRIIYGTGAAGLAEELDISLAEARALKSAVYDAMPGLEDLEKRLKKMGRRGERIRTWGGRLYSCEEPAFVKGSLRSFEYKLLNLLIQGSSADITKQAMIQVHEACPEARTMLQVYDQLLLSAPISGYKKTMARMKEAMEDVTLDLPLPTEGGTSKISWARLKNYKD